MRYPKWQSAYAGILAALLAISIPLAAYGIIADYRLFETGRTELIRSLEEPPVRMAGQFDKEISDMESLALCIQNSRLIRAYNYNVENATTWLKNLIIGEISNYSQTSSFTSDIFFCLKDSQTVYSSTGLYALNSVVPDVLPYSTWTKSQFVYDITTVRQPQWRKQENVIGRGSIVTLLYPIPLHNQSPYATILFLMGRQEFQKNILIHAYPNSIVQVRNNSNEIIFSSNSALNFEGLGPQTAETGALSTCTDYGGQSYYYTSASSEKNGFRFYSIVPAATVAEQMDYRQSPLFLRGIVRNAAFLAFTILLSVLLFQPWRRLAEGVRRAGATGSGVNSRKLLQFLNELSGSHKFLARRLEIFQEPIRRYILSSTLTGHPFEPDRKEALLEFQSSVLTKARYRPVVIALSRGEEEPIAPIIGKLEEQKEKWSPNGYEAHLLEAYAPRTLLLLLGYDQVPRQQPEQDLHKMRNMLSLLLGCKVCFGVGGSCQRLEELPQSLGQAYAVLRYRIIYGDSGVLMPSLLSSPHAMPGFYPSAITGDLESAVMACDSEKAQATCRALEEHIRNTAYSPEMTACILGDVSSRLLRCCLVLFGKDDRKNRLPHFFQRLSEPWSLTDLQEIVLSIVAAFPRQKLSGDRKGLDITALYRYIEDHYQEYEFSVQGMAIHFQVSASNLTHFFKKNTGTTILDFVNSKRIDKAALLLTSTATPLKQIVKDIGFSDTSTFIKKFKNHYGVTPGQYKEQNRSLGEPAGDS